MKLFVITFIFETECFQTLKIKESISGNTHIAKYSLLHASLYPAVSLGYEIATHITSGSYHFKRMIPSSPNSLL